MSDNNPWRDFPHDIYEKHMGHENVRQLEILARITGDQFALVENVREPVVALLGITDGNGLSNIPKGCCKAIIGMDINEEYLKICRERHSAMTELQLYSIDLMTEKDRAAELLKPADLVTANLLVKHIHLDNFMDIVRRLMKPIVSVTLQFNPDGQAVSHSGYEAAFDGIQQHGQDCDESALTGAMSDAGYVVIGRNEYALPNGKVFIRLDYKRDIAIRLAVPADAQDILKIYAPYITETSVSFETSVPTIEEFAARIENILAEYPFLVCDIGGGIEGYAYASKHRARAAYRFSADVSVYVAPEYQRLGIGKALYRRLFDLLKESEVYTIYAGITMPNDASVGLHKALGFTEVGIYHNVGYKLGKWHDVIWLEKPLKEYGHPKEGFIT